jgi:hypothetical protein
MLRGGESIGERCDSSHTPNALLERRPGDLLDASPGWNYQSMPSPEDSDQESEH